MRSTLLALLFVSGGILLLTACDGLFGNGVIDSPEREDSDCEAPSICFQNGRQEVTVTDKVGKAKPGETVNLTAKVEAFNNSTDNITFGVLGTGDGKVLAVERMESLGSGTIRISTTLPKQIKPGTQLYFRIAAEYTEQGARESFGPTEEKAVQVGRIRGEDNDSDCAAPSICFQNGRQEVTVTDKVGKAKPGETVNLTAKVEAFNNSTDNITFGVLGTGGGKVLAVERMESLGSGTIRISTTLPKQIKPGTQLYFRIAAEYTEQGARESFGPTKEKAAQVGSVRHPLR